jgi:tetratricopeptide (TPR) repeat protein
VNYVEAQELNINPKLEPSQRNQSKEKNKHFTKLQALILILSTLIVSIVGGYFISEKYLWSNTDQNRINEQLEYYKGLVDSQPNNAEHRVNLGYTYFLKKDNSEAIKQLKIATDLDNKYFGAYFNLGLVYLKEERFNDAIKQAQKTVELGPRNFKAHLLSGMTYRELKMYDEANASLKEALTLVPTNTDTITEIGRVAEDQKNFEDAEKFFKEALSYDPLYKPAAEGLERIAEKTKEK